MHHRSQLNANLQELRSGNRLDGKGGNGMITIKKGDLLQATEKVIAHQVNCHGVAGGLAAAVFDRYPDAENDYMQMVHRANPWSLLGMSQLTGQQKDGHIICNLFGQYQPGADYRPDALETALENLATTARVMGWSVALPWRISSLYANTWY